MIRWVRRAVITAVTLGALLVVVVASCFGIIAIAANDQVVADSSELPSAEVVIIPGARVFPDGNPSQVVGDRVAAGVALYEAGIVSHVLVSGDNSSEQYNEPAVMRDVAVRLGVPERDVTVDYAGFDTWDTCLRAHVQFGVTSAIFVTQDQYASRAAALCEAAGIQVTVFAIDPPPLPTRHRITGAIREPLAKVKAVGDLIRKPDALFGGDYIGLVGSEGMPPGGHPPDWDWKANTPATG